MSPIYSAIVIGYTVLMLVLIFAKVRVFKVLGLSLILSQCICLYDIFTKVPAQVMWLCNITVFLNIYLLFKFNQKVFDLFYFFGWIGCFFICLMPNNPYAVALKGQPVVWVAYWIKHIAPLVMSVYFFYIEKRKISRWSVYHGAVIWFLAYCGVMYFYNRIFNVNVLYLKEPAPFMEPMGRYYFLISICFGFFWVGILYLIANLLNGVKKQEPKITEVEEEKPVPVRVRKD